MNCLLLAAAPFAPVDQDYLFEARQMQALSFAVHIPIVCFGIAFPAFVLLLEGLWLRTGDPPLPDDRQTLVDVYRTTKGSGDLRRGDFAGSAERFERLAEELRPGIIAFVGEAAYEGVFRERPGHGPQKRRLGATRLFVLPSTSPANAAVPYRERLHWFRALRAEMRV